MNLFNIQNAYNQAKSRNWDRIYWAIDLHNTVLKSTYDNDRISSFYPLAEEVLKYLSDKDDVVLILFSSTPNKFIDQYLKLFVSKNIFFKYVNSNPEVPNTEYADFSDKFYFNILLDDKAGFEAETDWQFVMGELNRVYE